MESIIVKYNGMKAAAIVFEEGAAAATFQYFPEFIQTGIELSPLMMPLSNRIYQFPGIDKETFRGLPGLVADSLPDSFGNAILDQWLARQPDRTHGITPLERLRYTGSRGMGALEYSPPHQIKGLNASQNIELAELTKVAQAVLNERVNFDLEVGFAGQQEDKEMMESLLAVGTSAGGARPKAVLAFNHDFTQVRSGQANAPAGYTHYLLKFDGVSERDRAKQAFGDPLGYGVAEYVYYLLAKEAGIDMAFCALLPEGNRRHFITQRFDRYNGNEKRHVQTLSALAHVNYQLPGSYSYEQLFGVARQLKVPREDALELFRRMVFNHVLTNHDDHSKNFAFMLKDGKWRITPAYDVAFSYAKGNPWVEQHWMSMNGKRIGHNRDDLYQVAATCLPRVSKKEITDIIEQVLYSASQWEHLARQHNVPAPLIKTITDNLAINNF